LLSLASFPFLSFFFQVRKLKEHAMMLGSMHLLKDFYGWVPKTWEKASAMVGK